VHEGGDEQTDGVLTRSWRKVCTMRGENCPIASWTTTIVMDRTVATRLIIEAATAPRMPRAASGPPMTESGMSRKSVIESRVVVMTLRMRPATPYTSGMNHNPCRR